MATVDLNADLGESFGAWTMGDDAAMFGLVSSANVACGFHAGDPVTMLASCRLARETGTAIGAHVSYRDLAGFGRRAIDMPHDELLADVLYQASALQGIARLEGLEVAYLKPHGALYNRIAVDAEQADAVATASAMLGLPLLGLAGTAIDEAAGAAGIRFYREAFVDRAYSPDGTLLPRDRPGAVLTDPVAVAARALRMVVDGRVAAVGGNELAVEVESLCVHGDSPGAVEMARAVRAALTGAGVDIAAFR